MGDTYDSIDAMLLHDDDSGREEFDDVECPYCGKAAELCTGEVIYPRTPRLSDKLFYRCEPCNAYVGCHEGTGKPYGTLANAELRKARSDAHMFFDKLWMYSYSGMKRNQAYAWLRKQMGLSKDECHIGKFDLSQCRKAAELSRKKLASQ